MIEGPKPSGPRVISVTPAGRKRYLEVLVPYLLRHRHVIDEHHWWLNTRNEGDRDYVLSLCRQYPDFFRVHDRPVNDALGRHGSIWGFWRHAVERDAVYLRFDDDICYMADGAVEALLRHRLSRRQPLFVLGNIVNNAVCGHFHQQAGLIPPAWGRIGLDCLDRRGWEDPALTRRLHRLFLADIVRGRVESWKRAPMPFDGVSRFSINAMSWFGRDLADLPELAVDATPEEFFLTSILPRRLNRPNEICGDALFGHFAFFPQRDMVERLAPELLAGYRKIALGETFSGITVADDLRQWRRGAAWCLHHPRVALKAAFARLKPRHEHGPHARRIMATDATLVCGQSMRVPSAS
jgi:hypothetical protein